MNKISILGAGNVGSEVAYWCAIKELGNIVLWNRTKETAIGKALDLMESAPIARFNTRVKGTGNLKDTENSDIIVITLGIARKAGMMREELAGVNANIVRDIIKKTTKYSKGSILLIVTNPVDVMTYVAFKASKFKRNRVFGLAGALDSSRFRYFISKELNISIDEINALVIGSHGENMLPLPRFANVSGIPLFNLINNEKMRKLIKHTREAGAEIIKLLGANASFSVGAAIADSIEAILKDKRKIIPSSVYLNGEYSIRDCCMGVPVILGKNGVEKILELRLNAEEKKALNNAYKQIKSLINILNEKNKST